MDLLPASMRGLHDRKRIIFTSRLMTNDVEDARKVLEHIFRVSSLRNVEKEICSVLHFNPETFNILQVMEGPVDEIDNVFRLIAKDSRHTRVSRIYDSRINSKECWLSERGMSKGTKEGWQELKKRLKELKVGGKFADVKLMPLETIDSLPIAGDFDLNLCRLVYHSVFKDMAENRSFAMMQEIVEKAQRKNERMLVGGILHMDLSTRDVIQCLEGPRNAVKSLFCAIENDSRHENVEVLFLEKVETRIFKDWGMVWAKEESRKVLRDSLPENIVHKYPNLLLSN